jgi:hypothetical protein
MRTRLSIVFALVLPASAANVTAQTQPSLAGTWMFAGERNSNSSVGTRANFGTDFVIGQSGKAVTVERMAGGQKNSTTYPGDGSETETKTAQAVTKYKSRWEDAKFVLDVVNTSVNPGPDGKPVVTISTRKLWREGDTLISEWVITSPVQSTSICEYRQPPAGPPAPIQPVKTTLAALAWLAGNWEGKSGSASLEERWTPASGGAMLAVSRTVSNNRMVAFEFLRIIERDGTLVYVAQPNGRAPATEFTLTKIGATEAVFENPTHDFPKMITYRLAGDTLTATIADAAGLKPQQFVFKKAG